MNYRRGLWLVLVMLIVGGTVVHAQDPNAEQVRFKVEQWLLQELGKPNLLLVTYSYAGETWEDSSLGCPSPGETYTPGEIYGYSWSFLFDNMVRYEVHSTTDGNQAVLCGSMSASSDMRMSTYSTSTFNILVPEAWLAFPNADQTQVLFAPQEQITCGDPGARVTVVGRVASGITPDQLITDYLPRVDGQDDPAARETIGSFGRTTLFQTPCDAATRQWRLTAYVQYGVGYRVEQWVAASEYVRWEQLFLNMLSQFGPADGSFGGADLPPAVFGPTETPAAGTPTIAATPDASTPEVIGGANITPGAEQITLTPEIVGGATVTPEVTPDATAGTGTPVALAPLAPLPMTHLFVGDVFVGALNDIPGRGVTTVPTQERRYLGFSPDGLSITFIDLTSAQLRGFNAAEGKSARKLAEGVSPLFPPAWKPDNTEIAYAVTTDAALVEIHAVPAAGGESRLLGSFEFNNDCPAAAADPADTLYFQEAGANGLDHVLVWLAGDQILFSTNCAGGLSLLNLADGQITSLGDDLRGGVLSPDRNRFLARSETGLAILDLPGGQRTDLSSGADARQLAWAWDGLAVYYSTETIGDSVTLDNPADQTRGEEIFGTWPVSMTVYNVALVRLNLADSQESVIWQGQGRGIGRIAPAPDVSGVLFSFVPSSLTLAEVFQAGADPRNVHEAWPELSLYWLPTGESAARLLAYSGQPAFAPITLGGQQ